MLAQFAPYRLIFNEPAITSRQVMLDKETYFIKISEGMRFGIGECAIFRGLSSDDSPDYENKLAEVCSAISFGIIPDLTDWPSIRFGVETAFNALKNGNPFLPFPSAWSEGNDILTINGLVWMGTSAEMIRRVKSKIESGFRCIKLKIGGIDFEDELRILKMLRNSFSSDVLEIRLDANGAFDGVNVMPRLDVLSAFYIHSLEQPVKAGQTELMRNICKNSPIPIALDEELIGVNRYDAKRELINFIRPAYIILKPALCGGFSGAMEWIECAEQTDAGWWATSALESNVGLNAIAQWVYTLHPKMPQGLGTGALFTNNIESPIVLNGDRLSLDSNLKWNFPNLNLSKPF